jgi:hypothetical protein
MRHGLAFGGAAIKVVASGAVLIPSLMQPNECPDALG